MNVVSAKQGDTHGGGLRVPMKCMRSCKINSAPSSLSRAVLKFFEFATHRERLADINNMEVPNTETKDIHVLIIGAGITGLLIAQGLKKVHLFLNLPHFPTSSKQNRRLRTIWHSTSCYVLINHDSTIESSSTATANQI